MDWYLTVWKKFAQFQGRSRRKEYWYFTLFNVIAILVLMQLDKMFGWYNPQSQMGTLSMLYSLAVFIPSLAVGVRRLHDTNRSGWWLLISLIPLIGTLVMLYFMFADSQPGSNRFGENPKGVHALPNAPM